MKTRVHITALCLLASCHVFCQSGLLKTKTGLMAFFIRDKLSFTIRLDGDGGEPTRFQNADYLQILGNFDFHLAKATDLFPQKKTPSYYLAEYKLWEQHYIDSVTNAKRPYLTFGNFPKIADINNVSAWYYKVIPEDPKFSPVNTLFVDFYKNGYLLRFNLLTTQPVEKSYNLIGHLMNHITFYKNGLDVDRLRMALIKDAYFYEEE